MKKRFTVVVLGALGVVLLLMSGIWLGEGSASRRYETELTEYRQSISGLDQNGVRIDRMLEFYKPGDPYVELQIKTDAEFRAYCQENYPDAIYPSNEWTPEEVLQSYREHPETWGCFIDSYHMSGFYFAWTPDYQHCLIIDPDDAYFAYEKEYYKELTSGWLCVDGVRVYSYGRNTVDSVEPNALIEAYQSGEWNGEAIWSTDLSTCVNVDYWDGALHYRYQAWRYDETTDPEGFAYTGFDWQPWWRQSNAPENALAAIDSRYLEIDPWLASKTSTLWFVDCAMYVDLPVGYDTSEFLSTTQADKLGTFCLSSSGVQLFRNGELVQSWDCQIDPEVSKLAMGFSEPPPAYIHDYAYLCDGQRILALRDNGDVVVVLDRFVATNDSRSEFWGFSDNQLMYWKLSSYRFSSNPPIVLAEDVLEVDFSTLRLFTKSDGCYMITTRKPDGGVGDHHAEYLGEEDMSYYAELYLKLRYVATGW